MKKKQSGRIDTRKLFSELSPIDESILDTRFERELRNKRKDPRRHRTIIRAIKESYRNR